MGRILLFCATVFLSAFLLFQVQPVIGKYILPWFGSTPGVWTTCMLFFQVLLLGGYAYAHFLVSRLPARRQAYLHGGLLVLALVALPITPSADLVPDGRDAPITGILLVLAASVGVPYLLLSATGPLLQGWFARLHPGRSPYRLYALSNVGSLLALVSYPLYVERAWGLDEQTRTWSLGFGLFVLLCGGCAWTLQRGRVAAMPTPGPAPAGTGEAGPSEAAPSAEHAPTLGRALLWFLLAATGSALLLATTNQMCLDIAVIPFLWILPLALYLLSFIFTFDHARWYVRPLFLALLPLVLWRAFVLLETGVDEPLERQVAGYSLALFIGCMACHGELARSKPAPRHLTWFFLVVSIGGAAGGLLVALVAPYAFDDFSEYPLLLCATYAVALLAAFVDLGGRVARPAPRKVAVALGVLGGAVALLAILRATTGIFEPASWAEPGSAKDLETAGAWFDERRWWLWLPAAAVPLLAEVLRWLRRASFATWWGSLRVNALVAAGIVAGLGLVSLVAASTFVLRPAKATVLAKGRNFYGTLAIKEYYRGTESWDWTLRHGRIMHGFQYRKRPGWPTSYYGPESGVGLAIRNHPAYLGTGRSLRLGVVGLGSGTLAAYANAEIDPFVSWSDHDRYALPRRREPGDVVRYYEINPMVISWAWEHFTYLPDARERGADVDVFLGDARLVMERQLARDQGQRFDVLAVDAFSSDAIPIHLLTKECFDIYWGHLAEDGALAIHITNRFIDLGPVVRRLAKEVGKPLVHVSNYDNDDFGVDSSDWMIITSNESLLAELRRAEIRKDDDKPPAKLWTDDYSSVLDHVDWRDDDGVHEDRSWWDVGTIFGLPTFDELVREFWPRGPVSKPADDDADDGDEEGD